MDQKNDMKDRQEAKKRTIELVDRWHKQAEKIKKKHPSWSEEKVQNKMKKIIRRQVQQDIRIKDFSVKEMFEKRKKILVYRQEALDKTLNYIFSKNPDAIGAAIFELDCGCMRICGVAKTGEPAGDMIMVLGNPKNEKTGIQECEKCNLDGGADPDRCVNKAMVWPGAESEMPSKDVRLAIGKKVFGEKYSINDI
ncbi:MAG: hypothetical protein JW786_13920 [Desulfobacterales bacterium]|nr:hypothetical protein [Desulfobacterales bacterium]